MSSKTVGATYIASGRLITNSGANVAKKIVSATLAVVVILLLISSLGLSTLVAHAVGEDAQAAEESKAAKENAQNILKGLDPGIPESDKNGSFFFNQISGYEAKGDVTTFQGLLWSIFGIRYINKVNNAVVPSSTSEIAQKLGLNNPAEARYACNTDQLGAGTAFYHNCDVPNLMTEFIQDSFKMFDRSGAQNALAQNAYAGDLFGIPKNLPGDGSVPINPDFRSEKYTGLELYGYSLPWTTYLGEWDHIKTQTKARLLSNFGFFDHLGLTGAAIGGSIANGLTVAADNFSSELKNSGNIFQAIGGFYSGYFQGSVAGAIAPVLDSSDLNVLLSFSWYRVNYANTAYGIRQLTDAEIAAAIRLAFLQMLAASSPDEATIGEDLLSIADGGKKPRKPVAKCEVLQVAVNNETNKPSVLSWNEESAPTASQLEDPNYTGISQEACRTASAASFSKWVNAEGYDNQGPSGNSVAVEADFFKYDADGNRPADTVATWKSWNADTLNKGASLGVNCEASYPNDNQLADEIWGAFGSCWGGTVLGSSSPGTGYTGGKPAGTVVSPYAWNAVANKKFEEKQGEVNQDWVTNVLSQVMVQQFMQKNQESMNFNSPWRRYVCVNPDGTDMQGEGATFVYAFTMNGSVNPACGKELRAPIQNGIFGSGYTGGPNQNPRNDTRHIANFGDPISLLFLGGILELESKAQSFFMGIGQSAAKLSNEVISWTYMPILDSLGITDIIINLIAGFRDSLFFPLASMIIAVAACNILWRTLKNQAYREGFVSVLMICLVYISGSLLMYKSKETIDFVQKVPATLEEFVVGAIFSTSTVGNDELCTSTIAPPAGAGGIFGKLADTSSSQATRQLMCYNWRTFTFTPWVYGQFGEGFDKLYAKDAGGIPASASTWNNTNSSLVGKAGVNMGNGMVVENWALYQLDTLKTGTATTADKGLANGRVDPNFYRIVDAQYGPNNGAGTETRFQDAWSGVNPAARSSIAFLSPTLSVFGAIVVIAYSITKIIITLLSTLMLVFLPFAFLFGLFPSKRAKLKDYLMAIVAMMIQRVVIILVLSVFFVLLMTFAGAGEGSYFTTFLMGMLTCAAFWMWKKDIMGYVFSSLGNPQTGQKWRDSPGDAMREWPLLKTAMQKADQARDMGSAVMSATVGSVLSGRNPLTVKMENGKPKFGGAIADEVKSRSDLLFRKQRRGEGFEGIRSGVITAREVAKETRSNARLDEDTVEKLNDLFKIDPNASETPEADYLQRLDAYERLAKTAGYREIAMPVLEEGIHMKDSNGELMFKNIIVAEDNPTVEVAERPAEVPNNYDKLHKPQDRRLVQQHNKHETESLESRTKKAKIRASAEKLSDPALRRAFDKYSSTEVLPALEAFQLERDVKAKAKLAKTIDAQVSGDLEQVLAAIDAELSDAEGFTAGDRAAVKNLVKATAKESIKQQKAEHQMVRIEHHLKNGAQQEYIASDPRSAAKKAIADMNAMIDKAAEVDKTNKPVAP